MSLIIKKNTTFKIPRTPFLPSSLGGLALWLKAYAGVSKFSYNYVSQIVISGTSTPNLNGTYTAIGVPNPPSDGILPSYGFSGPSNGFSMGWNPNDNRFELLDGEGVGFVSGDGINWDVYGQYISQVIISGFTGDYVGANVTYNYSFIEGFLSGPGEEFYIIGSELINDNTSEVVATNTNTNYYGAWTLVNGTGSPTTTSFSIYPNGAIGGSVTTTTENTDNVTAWADQSGNGFNANGNVADGVNPTFVSNVKNGKPILRFGNNNDKTVLRTAPTTFGNNGEFTIFTVYKYDNTNNTWAELISKGDLATEAGSQFAISPRFISSFDPTQSAFGVMGYVDDTYSWSFLNQEPASTNWSIVCGTQSITNDSQKYFINGSLISESASVDAINQLNIAIGIGNGGADSTPWSANYGGFKGDLAEVIFYNRALTATERQQVEAYLNAKYAIFISKIIISGCTPSTSNGIYTRSSKGPTNQDDPDYPSVGATPFIGPNGNYISHNGGPGADWTLYDTQTDPMRQFVCSVNLSETSWYADEGGIFGTATNSSS